MTAVGAIAVKEFRDGLRNRWIIAATLLLGGLALALVFLGSAPAGTVGVDRMTVAVVSLSSLTVYLVPLIALMLAYDAIAGEDERGTLLLLLSYPVARWQVVVGKFIGHLAILTFAIMIGYGGAAVALVITESGGADWPPFLVMVASSILLGATFVAIGYLASALVRERATAAGIAVSVWVVMVLLYDLALLGLVVADQGLSGQLFQALLLANPTDSYRLFNLLGFEHVSLLSGMAGLADQAAIAPMVPLTILIAWTVAPLLAAIRIVQRREL